MADPAIDEPYGTTVIILVLLGSIFIGPTIFAFTHVRKIKILRLPSIDESSRNKASYWQVNTKNESLPYGTWYCTIVSRYELWYLVVLEYHSL